MPKQILMPEGEFDDEMEKRWRKGRMDERRWICEELWPHLFPNEMAMTGKSLDILWPKLVGRIMDLARASEKERKP
jgi:hypothetical protein